MPQRNDIILRAMEAVATLEDPLDRAELVAELAHAIAVCDATMSGAVSIAVAGALETARSIDDPSQRSRLLGLLAAAVPISGREAILARALASARAVSDQKTWAASLGALVSVLPREQQRPLLAEALASGRAIGDNQQLVEVLILVATAISEDDRGDAISVILSMIQTIRNDHSRALALANIVPLVPDAGRAAAVSAAFAAANKLGFGYGEILNVILSGLASLLPRSAGELAAAITQALTAARAIITPIERADALAHLIVHSRKSERVALFIKSMQSVGETPQYDYWTRNVLTYLANCVGLLPEAERPRLCCELLWLAEIVKCGEDVLTSSMSAVLASFAPTGGNAKIAALEAARAIRDDKNCVDIFVHMMSLARSVPTHELSEVLEEAIASIDMLGAASRRSVLFAAIAAYLPPGAHRALQSVALARSVGAAREIRSTTCGALALAAFVPTLPASERLAVDREAVTAAREVIAPEKHHAST